MTTGAIAGILSWGAPLPSDRCLIKILDFLEVPHTNLDVSGATFDVSEATAGGLRPFASASTIRHALAAGTPVKDMVHKLFEQAPAALVYGVTPETLSGRELNSLAEGVAAPTWLRPEPGDCYRVNSGCRDVCGTFSGLAWSPISWKEQVPAFERDAEHIETLIAVEKWPVFARHRRSSGETFVLCNLGVANLDEGVDENFDVHKLFIDLFPYVMFIQHAFPGAGWRPGRLHGSLIIDDPPLRPRYGFLNFRWLVQAMDEVGFSTDIALIPWNVARTQPSVAALIHARRGRFGVCVHGCDHTSSEFGAADPEHLAKLTTISVARMEAHRRRHGVEYERIMVFPQGVFSESAMEVLKSFNFLAAVNTEVIPSHNTSRASAVTLADVLTPAIMRYGGFPLFPRRKCSDRLVNFAADLFVGKPCLLVAHHTDFADGGRALVDLITAIRAVAPDLEWSSLGTVLRRTHLWRREVDGSRWVRMFASELSLTGENAAERDVQVVKTEGDRQWLGEVLIDGCHADFDWSADLLTIPVKLRPGQSTTVRVLYHNRFSGADTRLGARYRFKASMRRSLCDIRDNYVDIGRHRLQRLWR